MMGNKNQKYHKNVSRLKQFSAAMGMVKLSKFRRFIFVL